MKTIKILYAATAMFLCAGLCSCDEDDLDGQSIFGNQSATQQNAFDRWLKTNFVDTYNIEVKYRFEDRESDMSHNLTPADYDNAVAMAKLVKVLWLDVYKEIAGETFIRTYCPKVIHLVGSYAYDKQGAVVQGTAEGGIKVTLYNINSLLDHKLNYDYINEEYFKVMHHEFCHILHQTKSFTTDFNLISAGQYQAASWVNVDEEEAHEWGFVDAYATDKPIEDFAQTFARFIINTPESWEAGYLLNADGERTEGADKIEQKLDIIRDYMKTKWGIDIDALRDLIQERGSKLAEMDLSTNI